MTSGSFKVMAAGGESCKRPTPNTTPVSLQWQSVIRTARKISEDCWAHSVINSQQLSMLQTMEWQVKQLRLFMFGDYDYVFLMKFCGLSGAQEIHNTASKS